MLLIREKLSALTKNMIRIHKKGRNVSVPALYGRLKATLFVPMTFKSSLLEYYHFPGRSMFARLQSVVQYACGW